MKTKQMLVIAIMTVMALVPASLVYADLDDHTAQEEAAGAVIWQQMQAEELACVGLSDNNFASLGEYFMGQMLGGAHDAMNTHMIQMMGEDGEKQVHVVMGQRMSGCDVDAEFPMGTMPMMTNMMGGGASGMMGGGSMMGGSGIGGFMDGSFMGGSMGWFWILLLASIIGGTVWAVRAGRSENQSPLDILKTRYAKGEIDEKEYEKSKKALSA